MPHTSLTKSKADTLGLFLRKVAASASRTICDFGTRRCRAVASRWALILSGILQVIVVMPFDNTELHIEQYLKLGGDIRVERSSVVFIRDPDSQKADFASMRACARVAPLQLGQEIAQIHVRPVIGRLI